MQTGKSGKIISKSPKVWIVRESQRKSGDLKKMLYLVRESQEIFFVQIFDMRVGTVSVAVQVFYF